MSSKQAYIVAAGRTAGARRNGRLAAWHPADLAGKVLDALVARSFIDDCIDLYVRGELDATRASMAKLWASERAQKVVDNCLQLFGGYGYMNEYPIAQMYKNVRVKRIYGGTSEIMKLLIARSLAA